MGVTWTVLSRSGCHLCAEMIELLESEGEPLGVRFKVVDVDTDPALRRRFGDVVPVLLRDDQPVAKVRLNPQALSRLIRRSRSGN